jgi:hypothetical protein
MELNISELDNMNSNELFDYNTFEQGQNYWEQTKPKKKVTFDDILTNMNLVINKAGVLQFMSSQQSQDQCQNQYQDQYQKHNQDQYQKHNQDQYQKPQKQIQESIDPSLKHSFIYNKYFKDYVNPNLEKPKPLVPKTMEELKEMLIQEKMIAQQQRQRINQIKSKKLMFTTNTNINVNNIVPSKNNLKTMSFR